MKGIVAITRVFVIYFESIFCNIKLKLNSNGNISSARVSSTFAKHDGSFVGLAGIAEQLTAATGTVTGTSDRGDAEYPGEIQVASV